MEKKYWSSDYAVFPIVLHKFFCNLLIKGINYSSFSLVFDKSHLRENEEDTVHEISPNCCSFKLSPFLALYRHTCALEVLYCVSGLFMLAEMSTFCIATV